MGVKISRWRGGRSYVNLVERGWLAKVQSQESRKGRHGVNCAKNAPWAHLSGEGVAANDRTRTMQLDIRIFGGYREELSSLLGFRPYRRPALFRCLNEPLPASGTESPFRLWGFRRDQLRCWLGLLPSRSPPLTLRRGDSFLCGRTHCSLSTGGNHWRVFSGPVGFGPTRRGHTKACSNVFDLLFDMLALRLVSHECSRQNVTVNNHPRPMISHGS